MMKCPYCNKELDDGAVFCGGCGAKLDGTPVAEEVKATEATPVVEPTPAVEAKANPLAGILEKVKALPKKTLAIGGGAVVAVILIIALLVSIFGGVNQPNYVVYMKDDELHINMLVGKESIEITSDFAGDYSNPLNLYYRATSLVSVTADEKTVIYPDKFDYDNYTFDLYYRSTTDKKGDDEKIAEEVSSYVLSEDGKRMVYVCEKGLYEFDFKDSEKIESDVYSYYTTADCKTIVYVTDDGELHKKTFGKDDDERLEKDVRVRAVSEDLKKIYFTKDDKFYVIDGNKEKEKIDSDVSSVLMAYNSGEVYYIKTTYDTKTLDKYVEDDMAAYDATLTQPVYPNNADFDWPEYPYSYESSWGTYWEDIEAYAGCSSYDEAYDLYVELYNKVYEEYEAACDKYYEEYSVWSEKSDRDYYRERMAEWEIEITKTALYYYNGKESVEVLEDISTSSYDVSLRDQSAVAVVLAETNGNVTKLKLSEITSLYDAEDQVEEMLKATATLTIVTKGTSKAVDAEDPKYISLSGDAKTVFFYTDIEDYYYGTLNKAAVSDAKAEEIDSDVYVTYINATEDGDYYYIKDNYYSGDLYLNGEKIAKDVYAGSIRYADNLKKFYYMADVDDNEGTLYYYDGKEHEIADNVLTAIAVTADGGVLYFEDYDQDDYTGTLYYSENGKEGTEIDDDVQIVVKPYMYMN